VAQDVIGQDFSDAIRPVFFETEYPDFLYATHGGMVFVIEFRGRAYGLTCGHVFKDFEPGKLFVTDEKRAKKGSMPARIKTLCYPSSPIDAAEDTDITDLCVLEFADYVAPDFFKGSAYVIDEKTVTTSKIGHKLLAAGVLKEKSWIVPPDIVIGYCRLEFVDVGPYVDPILRRGTAECNEPPAEPGALRF